MLHPVNVSPGSQPCLPSAPGSGGPVPHPSLLAQEKYPASQPAAHSGGRRAHRARRRAVRGRATGAGTARLPAASPAAAARVRPARPPLRAPSVSARPERGRGWGQAAGGAGSGRDPPRGRGQARRTGPRTYQSRPVAGWSLPARSVGTRAALLLGGCLVSPFQVRGRPTTPRYPLGGQRIQVMHRSFTAR